MTAGNIQNSDRSALPVVLILPHAPPILENQNKPEDSWRADLKSWKEYHESDWFKDQVIEPDLPHNGKSILVRWLKEVGEGKGWTCCVPLDGEGNRCIRPFGRPDRALAHVREHLDLKPFPCKGTCRTKGWYVRKFS